VVPATNRLIVVTGGGGIGRAAALLCARRGDRVAILDKNGDSAIEAAAGARAAGASGPRTIPNPRNRIMILRITG
jgi:NAD(P)-dependent dehydrogenase (short-subunit alcohol dehydrogenase family)